MARSSPRIRLVERLNVEYLKGQIEAGSGEQTKKALQHVCKLYRGGFRLPPEQLAGFEQSIVGLLYTQRQDPKVRRWALNTLARLGREANCLVAVQQALLDFGEEPQTVAAAIAAIYRMSPANARKALDRVYVDPEISTLAALQHVPVDHLDLSALPIQVDTASADVLRLALVVVGLDRAPPNMLNPRHTNAEMVNALGNHHDRIVAQYTVWAITENPNLGVSDLGIKLQDIEQQPANVRAWLLQLVAMTAEDAERHLEYLELGTRDPDAEARIGLATGLKATFFDGLDEIVLNWFVSESDLEVRQLLVEHMVRNATRSGNYWEMVAELYEKEPRQSPMRRRIEVAAAGTSIYVKLKQIDAGSLNDLFTRQGIAMTTNNTFNIQGGVQGAAVSMGGKAENKGEVAIHYNPQTIELIREELSKLERDLHASALEPSTKHEALTHVSAAKTEPTPDKVEKVVRVLSQIETGAAKAAGIGVSIASVVATLSQILGS